MVARVRDDAEDLDQSGRGKHSGVDVVGEFTFAFTVRDGKITEWRIFVHEDQAMAALGLPG